MPPPRGISQINAVDKTGETSIFVFSHTDSLARVHKYTHSKQKTVHTIIKYQCYDYVWDKDKYFDIVARLTYNVIRIIDVTFNGLQMHGKLLQATDDNDKNYKDYELECPKCCRVISRVPYTKVDKKSGISPLAKNHFGINVSPITIADNGRRTCIDCENSSNFKVCCFYIEHPDIPKKCLEYCLRCYHDERRIVKDVKNPFTICFGKCDVEAFLGDLWQKSKPCLIKMNVNKKSFRRRNRSYTLPYPSTFKDLQRMLFDLFQKKGKLLKQFNCRKHVESIPFPTLQQICVLKFVEIALTKEVDHVSFTRGLTNLIVDPYLFEEIESLYIFLYQRVLKRENYILTGGNANRPNKQTGILKGEKSEKKKKFYEKYSDENKFF